MARARAVAAHLPVEVDVDALVFGRAALLGLTSRGRVSANGACHLMPATDGWAAVNLARPADREALPAVIRGVVDHDDPWSALAAFASEREAAAVAARCQLLGIPAAVLDDETVSGPDAVTVHRCGQPRHKPGEPREAALVLDLSAMWAGPLCAHLLGLAGLRVCKLESVHRPDGARMGDPRFFEELNAGKEMVTLDFRTDAGRARLAGWVEQADVVVEASRPRALEQLGIVAADVVAGRPGKVWVSITGYGRSGDDADKVAFGDDAAVAGGLVARDEAGLPIFCGDAIADPMAGLFAAAAALECWAGGGGALVEVKMAAVAKQLEAGTGDAADPR